MASHPPPVLYSVDLEGCTRMPTLSSEHIAAEFVRALEEAGATVVEAHSHHFPGAGLTCVLILSESHAVLHTWPETGTANVDIFSCSNRLRSHAAIDTLGTTFRATFVSVKEVPRANGYGPSLEPVD